MENELNNPSRNFRSEKFIWSEFLAEWKTAKWTRVLFNYIVVCEMLAVETLLCSLEFVTYNQEILWAEPSKNNQMVYHQRVLPFNLNIWYSFNSHIVEKNLQLKHFDTLSLSITFHIHNQIYNFIRIFKNI